jgi:hypothetical protein
VISGGQDNLGTMCRAPDNRSMIGPADKSPLTRTFGKSARRDNPLFRLSDDME